MLARLGGDEFLILLPDLAPTDGEAAARARRRRGRRPARRAVQGLGRRLPRPREHRHLAVPRRRRRRRSSCSSTPTWRCTRARAAAARPRPSSRTSPRTRSSGSRCRRGCGARSPATSSSCTTSRSSSCRAARLASMEALLRWNDPDRGLVYPDDFIPAAEEMSLLEPIGDWVIGAHRPADARLARAGPAAARELQRLAAPAPPAGLRRRADRAAGGARIDPSWLTMELTESATLREPERIGPILRELNEGGLRLAIDDFGAGWSSLARLRLLPVHIAQDRPLVPARDPRGSGSRCNCRCSHRPGRRARHGHRGRGRRDPRAGAVPGRAGLPARAGPLLRRPRAGRGATEALRDASSD